MLCERCQEIFQGYWTMKRGALLEHHMTNDSFLSAVHQGCYICTKNWSKLNFGCGTASR
jgi:hypothetical protein